MTVVGFFVVFAGFALLNYERLACELARRGSSDSRLLETNKDPRWNDGD